MVVTKTETGFSVVSSFLEQFGEGDEIVLSLSSNCCDNETLTQNYLEVGESLEIETAWNNVEGVYTFTLVYTSGDVVLSQKICYFNEIDLACEVGKIIAENCSSDVHFDYFMLINMQNCACDCNNMCKIYQRILKKLDKDFCCDEITNQPCATC
jgi:hypothetical protein